MTIYRNRGAWASTLQWCSEHRRKIRNYKPEFVALQIKTKLWLSGFDAIMAMLRQKPDMYGIAVQQLYGRAMEFS
jgi:hypothetical protein